MGQVETLLSSFNSSRLKLQMTGGRVGCHYSGHFSPGAGADFSTGLRLEGGIHLSDQTRAELTRSIDSGLNVTSLYAVLIKTPSFVSASQLLPEHRRIQTEPTPVQVNTQMSEPPTLLSYYLSCGEKVRHVCFGATTGQLIHWDSSLWKVQI